MELASARYDCGERTRRAGEKLGPGLLVCREPCGVFLAVDACEMLKWCKYLSALIGSIFKDEVLHFEPTLCMGYQRVRRP